MASQNSLTPLELLPVELLQMILAQMDSPQDLYAAIKASKRLAQAFAGHREPILITVIQSSLDRVNPDIFKWMLGIIRIPTYENLAYVADLNATALEASGEPEEEWTPSSPLWSHGPNTPHISDHEARREKEIRRLATDFVLNDMASISHGISKEAIDSSPVPCLSRAKDAEQRAENKRIVDEVAELYGQLRKHTKWWSSPFPSLKATRTVFSQRRYALFRLSTSLPSKWW